MALHSWKHTFCPGRLNGQELKPAAESGGEIFHVSEGGEMNFPSVLGCGMTMKSVRSMKQVDSKSAFLHCSDPSSHIKSIKQSADLSAHW